MIPDCPPPQRADRGPLFTNLRLKKTDVPIDFQAGLPLFYVQPVQRELYEGRLLDDFNVVSDLQDWSDVEWESYRETVVAPNLVEYKAPGKHAVKLRRRRRQLFE
jgi:hypothetical protein